VNDSVFLLNGERRDPDGDQTVLAVREAVPRVSGDFEEEAAVMASVRKLLLRRPAKRNPTKHKRPRDVGEFLLARVASRCFGVRFVIPMDGNAEASDARDGSLAVVGFEFRPVSVCCGCSKSVPKV